MQITPSTRPTETISNANLLLATVVHDEAWRAYAKTELEQLAKFVDEGKARQEASTEPEVRQHVQRLVANLETVQSRLQKAYLPELDRLDDWADLSTSQPHTTSMVSMLPTKEREYFRQAKVLLTDGKEGDVIVTNIRAIIGPKTYAMSGVTSVGIAHMPTTLNQILGLIFVGFMVVMFGPANKAISFGLALVICFLLYYFLFRARYAVALVTASGEQKVLISRSKSLIAAIVAALEHAIIARG